MYKIIKDGIPVALTEAPNYIKRQENGCFALCPESEAQGIAHGGQIFHLLGCPDLEGAAGTVLLAAADAGEAIGDAQGAVDDLVVASLGTDTTILEIQKAIDDLVVASLEGGVSNV